MKYKIVEIFQSVQGEGYHAGRAASFIRFAGCNLKCGFCDTNHSHGSEITDTEILQRIGDGPEFVVLTGGEPTLQLTPSLVSLIGKDHVVAIETNGTMPVSHLPLDYITVSPKTAKIALGRADEIRVCVSAKNAAVLADRWRGFDARHHFLSPAFDGDKIVPSNVAAAIAVVLRDGRWRLSLQQHKLIGVR